MKRLSIVLVLILTAGVVSAQRILPRNDFDGDGASDLAVYNAATGEWFVRNLAGKLIVWAKQWGFAGALPVPADYDGDRRCDLAVFDPTSGRWYILSMNGEILAWGKRFGYAGAVPVPADYDGDGRADLGIYDLGTGRWYVKSLADGSRIYWAKQWGFPGDERPWELVPTSTVLPVPYDYDRDGITDLAVYYRGWTMDDSGWYIRGSAGQNWLPSVWGSAGSLPAPGRYRSVVDPKWPAGIGIYKVLDATFYSPYMFPQTGGVYGRTLAVPGLDFDGNGWEDHAAYDYYSGLWWISLNDGDGNANQSGTAYQQPPRADTYWGFSGAIPANIYSTIYAACGYTLKPW